jgi:hypothetical protein
MKLYKLLYVLVLLIAQSRTQETTTTSTPEFNGDPRLCTVNSSTPSPSDPLLPRFPPQAQFGLERVEIKHISNTTFPSELTLYQYFYDYDANKLITIKNQNGLIETSFSYYEILKKSTYFMGAFCVVTALSQNIGTGTYKIMF